MNNEEITRYGQKLIRRYFWDPLPKNEDQTSTIWCLGRRYQSHPPSPPEEQTIPKDVSNDKPNEPTILEARAEHTEDRSKEQAPQSHDDSLNLDEALEGWPLAFVVDFESKILMSYRSNFPQIAADTKAAASLSWSDRLRGLGAAQNLTTDKNWGCMIRTGQSTLVNTLVLLRLGRDWRTGQEPEKEKELLSLFADDPSAPFSIHKFVAHGAAACGKHPGEWFGPSATARCIQALTDAHRESGLRVYVRTDDSDVYEDTFLHIARGDDNVFKPTLILLGTRLGIDRVTPVYHASLKKALEMPQSIGIAGGRPSSSHYFIGTQGSTFFYLDPHSTRPMLPLHPSDADVATCHTRRLRRIDVSEMDPSMLLGFLIRDEQDWASWRSAISEPGTIGPEGKKGKSIVHVHDKEPQYTSSGMEGDAEGERREAVDEVQSCDEDDEEHDI